MTITENVAEVKRRIAAAAEKAGRAPSEILLVAASKMNDASRVREAVAAGVDACGENRVQEMLEKNALGAYEGVPLHFIGHLQKNKVKFWLWNNMGVIVSAIAFVPFKSIPIHEISFLFNLISFIGL